MRYLRILYFKGKCRLITRGKILIIAIIAIAQSCREPFFPETSEYESLLVVEGKLTDNVGPYSIRLTRTSSLSDKESYPEQNAFVTIEEEFGETIQLTEDERGIYLTPEYFIATSGKKYKITIERSNGESYESDYEQLASSGSIESVSYNYKSWTEDRDGHKKDLEGLEFEVDASAPSGIQYFKFEYSDIWEVHSFITYNSHPDICWSESTGSNIIIHSTSDLSNSIIKDFEVVTISNESNRLFYHYGIQIKMLSISKNAYDYYSGLNKISQQSGSLYDPPPAQIVGNIRCLTNPGKLCLGYFLVAGEAASDYQFIKRADTPIQYCSTGNEYCQVYDVTIYESGVYRNWGYELISEYFNSIDTTIHHIYINYESCYNCSKYANEIKPSFWPE